MQGRRHALLDPGEETEGLVKPRATDTFWLQGVLLGVGRLVRLLCRALVVRLLEADIRSDFAPRRFQAYSVRQ